MARLNYPHTINRDKKYKGIADLGLHLYQIDKSLIMTNSVDLIPQQFLVLLAEKWSALGYDGWALAESHDAQKKVIKNSVALHRKKGTPWSIRMIIRLLGFGEIELTEGLWDNQRDGTIKRDGLYYHGDESKWAHYRVLLKLAITNEQAAILRDVLDSYAPARCVLASLDYRAVAIRHNGVAIRNGIYNRGTA